MNKQQEEEFRQIRVRQAESIKAEVHKHKVCLVCSSVSRISVGLCWICHSYQWSYDPEDVIAAVDEAATSAFPFTLGYAPSSSR